MRMVSPRTRPITCTFRRLPRGPLGAHAAASCTARLKQDRTFSRIVGWRGIRRRAVRAYRSASPRLSPPHHTALPTRQPVTTLLNRAVRRAWRGMVRTPFTATERRAHTRAAHALRHAFAAALDQPGRGGRARRPWIHTPLPLQHR